MNFLEERIMKDGIVKPGNVLTVDSFLNHQMDIALMDQMGKEWVQVIKDTELARAEYMKNRTLENADKLIATICPAGRKVT